MTPTFSAAWRSAFTTAGLVLLDASRATFTSAAKSSSKPREKAQELRRLTRIFALLFVAAIGASSAATYLVASEPISINGRRELFLDDLMVGRLEGGAQRVFHKPVPREVVMTFDQPWEGNTADDWLSREKSLAVLSSPDGIRWTLMQDQGVFAQEGFFDSVNLAFWDPNTRAYRAYFRDARQPGWIRDIKTGTSSDFRNWTQGAWLSHTSKPSAQFYTNGIRPYHRAPHLYLGFPGMYEDREWSPAMAQLPDTESLSMNFASSAFGSLRVEIQNADGKPLPGFALADSIELYGDTVARNALWKNNPDLDALSGKPVRLRFVMRDADLYSIKFEESK